ncbi:uncharacterized protein LOC111695946 isoform X2 [Eurytemora carolleeae]|uniref:uncharacterized protein LOC111695946 isoform X2 n=1 Tax=Eurytemora carolleeae TaxID=1294199 RepID=UPI000C771890|nr:uncharacterized protein LOC111695946 isoform X2 [Eurytemora carolleeae]|eukprot:XP_023321193.1 uncharacterized protein LOC111695946 isoform X2 [Eurytemora affinis]
MHHQILIVFVLACPCFYAIPQVNSEIYSEEDLLAIDSGLVESVASAPAFVSQSFKIPSGPGNPSKQTVKPVPVQPTGFAGGGQLVSYRNTFNKDGSYSFGYELDDGQKREEEGQMTNGGYSVSGSWAYTGTDGILRTVVFTADQNGYRPRETLVCFEMDEY